MAVINYRRNSSSQQLGDVVGWLGMSSNACPTPSTTITTHGYPGDKPAGSMWYVPTCPPLTWACGAYTATSTCDTYPGQSGSAMWVASTYVAYGNHIQGLTTYNRHCMLNSAKWPSIYAWAYQKPT
ncbi:hypothetical protein JKP88DRAFT_286334 [Tribonema minus]|nr:hypothetical protein JKP88DRAFT_286334 [Tribonema minus]